MSKNASVGSQNQGEIYMTRRYSRHALIVSFLFVLWGCGGSSGEGDIQSEGELLPPPVQTFVGVPIDGEVSITYGPNFDVSTTASVNGGPQETISSSFDPNGDEGQFLSAASVGVVGATMVTGDSRLCSVIAQNTGSQLIADPLSQLLFLQLSTDEQLISQNEIIGVDDQIFALERTVSTFLIDTLDGTVVGTRPATRLDNIFVFSADQTTLGFGLAIFATCASATETFGQFEPEFRQIFSTIEIR